MPTTPIAWRVPRRKRRGGQPKLYVAEAAIVEVSIMGAAIVAPAKWEAPVGSLIEIYWEDLSGIVLVRRAGRYQGSENFYLYGVEFAETPSRVGKAIYEFFVVEPADRLAQQHGTGGTHRMARTPSVWAEPDGSSAEV